jgi:hypothetical protein
MGGGLVAPLAQATTTNVRYASPLGHGSSCSVRLPCSIVTAINSSPGHSDIRLRSGSYGSAQHPLTTELDTNGEDAIHGMNPTSSPVIYEAASGYGFFLQPESQLTGVRLVYSGTGDGLGSEGTVSRVSVSASADGAAACQDLGSMTTVLCVASGEDAAGLIVDLPDNGNALSFSVSIDGATAVATGADSVGIEVSTPQGDSLDVTATNTIATGSAYGVEVLAVGGAQFGSFSKLTASHSDLVSSNSPTGGASLVTDDTDITTPPKFAAAAQGNFREVLGSPTVDRGAPEPANSLDLAGNPRTIGHAPDMGAYELPLKPIFSAPPQVVSVRTRAARMGCHLWAVDMPTTFRLIAVHGKQTVRSKPVHLNNLKKPKTEKITIHGLTPNRTYFVHLVARNAGGTTTTKPQRIRTKP